MAAAAYSYKRIIYHMYTDCCARLGFKVLIICKHLTQCKFQWRNKHLSTSHDTIAMIPLAECTTYLHCTDGPIHICTHSNRRQYILVVCTSLPHPLCSALWNSSQYCLLAEQIFVLHLYYDKSIITWLKPAVLQCIYITYNTAI